MQTVSHEGILGKVEQFTQEGLNEALQRKDVHHVDVFDGTPENIEHRKSMQGKKLNLKVHTGFKKTGSINNKAGIKLEINIKGKNGK